MLQIQPVFSQSTQYEVLAERWGLLFEALELSFDGVSEEKYAWYRTCGRVHSLHGAFIDVNPASGDREIAFVSQDRMEESCEKALTCGAKNVVFHSSCFPFLRGGYLEVWLERSASYYTYLAEKYPRLSFFIENSFDIDPGPIRGLMERLTVKNVGVCLDVGHAHYARAPLEEWFDALGEYVGYLHLSDNRGVYDDHLPLGEGTVDWKKAGKWISALGKDIPVTLEVGSADGILRSLDFLSKSDDLGGLL